MFYTLPNNDIFTSGMNKDLVKIGIILPRIERWSSFYGGAVARFTYETLKRTDSSSFDITVFGKSCNTHHAYQYNLIEPRLGFLLINLDKWLSKMKIQFDGWVYLLTMFFRLRKKDIIYIHHRPHYALILRKMGYKGKIIIHLHGDFHFSSSKFIKNITDASDIVISCSQKIAERLFIKDNSNLHKSRILYNGANEEIFTYRNLVNRKKQILFVGRIDEIKGVHNLLSAFSKLTIEFPEWNLIMAGSAKFGGNKTLTSFEKTVKELIEEINQIEKRVFHLGYIQHVELIRIFHESKIFCLPSIVHDAFPLVIIEAMYSGTPIVASKMGGIPEAVGENGTLCEPNSEDLYLGLKDLMLNNEKQHKFSQKSRKRAEQLFNWDKITKDQINILNEII